jgi:hypothetical protein
MTNLWIRVARYGDDPTPESWENRRQRVDRYLERQQGQQATMPLRHKWGPSARNDEIHGIIADHDGPVDDRHWEHLPDQSVSLKQPIHTHQGFVHPEMVREKLRQDADEDYWPDDYREYTPGGDEAKFVRHQGQHYLVDGHHRFAKARLMGESSMWGKVFDTANPEHKQSHCYECHENETQDEGDWDHDSGGCEKCQRHGWSM